jgi:hypothetical protein
LETLFAVFGSDGDVPVVFQQTGKIDDRIGLIVDDKNGLLVGHGLSSRCYGSAGMPLCLRFTFEALMIPQKALGQYS